MTEDIRLQRRAKRRAQNRTDILDAAEFVFAHEGFKDGSLRKIAERSGFSPAAIYLFFDNKERLVAETLSRRGDELLIEWPTVSSTRWASSTWSLTRPRPSSVLDRRSDSCSATYGVGSP